MGAVTSKDGKISDVRVRLEDVTGLKRFVVGTVNLALSVRMVRSEAAQAAERILAARAAKR